VAWLFIALLIVVPLGSLVWGWRVWQARFGARQVDTQQMEAVMLAQARAKLDSHAANPYAPVPQAATPIQAFEPGLALGATPANPLAEQKKHGRPPALLGEAERGIYDRLKSCVGDYPLSFGVDVARLISDAQPGLPRIQVDYLVCRKDFSPAVVIFLDRGHPDPQRERVIKLLSQSRLRILLWDVAHPPERDAMYAQVFKSKTGAEV